MKSKIFTILFISIALISTVVIFNVYATGNGGDCDSHNPEAENGNSCDHTKNGEACDSHESGKECDKTCDKTCDQNKESCMKTIEDLEVVNLNGRVTVTNLVLPVLNAADGEAYYLVLKPMIASTLLKIDDGDEMSVEGYLIDDSMLQNCRWKQEPYTDSKVVIAKLITINGEEYNLAELWNEMHSGRKHRRQCSF